MLSRQTSAVICKTLSCLILLLMVLASSTVLIVPIAHATPVTNYTGPSLRLPWASGSYGISQSYNCGDHNGPNYPTYTWDQYAIDFAFGGNQVQLTAVFAGTIHYGTYDGTGYGNSIWITNGNWKAVYAHLGTSQTDTGIQVANGQQVTQGQNIAMSGWSGHVIPAGSGGGHLHFSLRYKTSELSNQYDGDSAKPEPMSGYGQGSGGDGISFAEYGNCGSRSGSFNPVPNSPGGWWNTPPTPNDGTYTTGSTLNISVHAHDYTGSGLDHVNITWLDTGQYGNQTWSKQTQTNAANTTDTDFVASIPAPLTNLTNELLVSFDVYAKNGTSQLAPNGVHRYCLPGKSSCLPYTTVGSSTGGSGPSDGFTVYSGTNYSGSYETFTYSSNTTCIGLDQVAGKNESVKLTGNYAGNYSGVMYHDANCGTYLARYGTDSTDIGTGLYNQFGSMRLEKVNDTTCVANPATDNGIIIYRDPNYGTGGGCKLITADVPDLGALSYTRITSIQFVGNFIGHKQATFYKDANYGTSCAVYTADQSNLRDCAIIDLVSIKIADFTPSNNGSANIASTATRDHSGTDAVVDNNLNTEWAGIGKSMLGFVWSTPQTIKDIVAWDRQPSSQGESIGTMDIVFSDGTIIQHVDMTSAGPRCADISFPAKTVTWVNFVPQDASDSAGFEEIQIWNNNGDGSIYSPLACPMHFPVTPATGSGPAPTPFACIPGNGQVSFFSDANYGGSCGVEPISQIGEPNSFGVPNDTMSSVKFGTGVGQVILYSDRDFAGNTITLTGDTPDLNTLSFDNMVSSVKIIAGTSPTPTPTPTPTATSSPTPTATATPTPSGQQSIVYDQGLASGWADWSWSSTRNLTDTSHPLTGTQDLVWTATSGYAGLYLHNAGVSTAGYTVISFALQATQAGQKVKVELFDHTDTAIGSPYVIADPAVGHYTVYSIPLSTLGGANTTIDGFAIQDNTGNAQPALYVDTIALRGVSPVSMYDEGLSSGWADWSWGSTRNLVDTSHPNTGSQDISWTVNSAYAGLYFHSATGINTTGYSYVVFALRATQSGQSVQLQLQDANDAAIGSPVAVGGTPNSSGYTLYAVPLSTLGGTSKVINGFVIEDSTGSSQPAMFVDTISLV